MWCWQDRVHGWTCGADADAGLLGCCGRLNLGVVARRQAELTWSRNRAKSGPPRQERLGQTFGDGGGVFADSTNENSESSVTLPRSRFLRPSNI